MCFIFYFLSLSLSLSPFPRPVLHYGSLLILIFVILSQEVTVSILIAHSLTSSYSNHAVSYTHIALYPLTTPPSDISGSSTNHQREGYCEAGFSVGVSNTSAQQQSVRSSIIVQCLMFSSGNCPGSFHINRNPWPQIQRWWCILL